MELLAAEAGRVAALEIGSEAVALAIARAASGTLVSITNDYVARKPLRRYELVGTQGTLVWDLSRKSLTFDDGTTVEDLPLLADGFDVAATYTRIMHDFVAAVTQVGRAICKVLRMVSPAPTCRSTAMRSLDAEQMSEKPSVALAADLFLGH